MQTALGRATRAHYEAFPFIEGGEERVRLWRRRLRADLPDQLIRGTRILDVGSSIGEVAQSLRLRGADVVCVDVTHTALVRNRQLHPGAQTAQADALKLPFADATFDHAISIGVLHHTPDCRRGLEELARVTRPGGTLLVLLYDRGTPYHAAYLATEGLRRHVPVDRLRKTAGQMAGTLPVRSKAADSSAPQRRTGAPPGG
ncbi:class I SAM-dependent methyltransferase [Streptomyces sp. NPDC002926]